MYTIDEAHDKPIRSIEYVEKKGILLSGGGDGLIKMWNV